MKFLFIGSTIAHLTLSVDPCDCKTGFLQRTDSNILKTDEEGNPCGCNFQRTTSRDTLQGLPLPALRERVSALESETQQLKTDVEHQTEKNRAALTKRKKQVDQMWNDQAKLENKTEDEDEKRALKIKAHSGDVKEKEQKLEKLNEELSTLRKEWNTINGDVTVELAKMGSCPGCNAKKFLLLDSKEEPMDLVLKIERLELERNALQKEQMDNQSGFMAEMRQLDAEQEKVENKADRYASLEKKYRLQDDKRKKLIKDQINILDPVIKDREDAVARTKSSIEKAKGHMDNLKAEIVKCCK